VQLDKRREDQKYEPATRKCLSGKRRRVAQKLLGELRL
jgi:hypothetical protein